MRSDQRQRIWGYVKQHRVVSIMAGHLAVLSVMGVVLFNTALGSALVSAFAQSPCSSGDQTYTVMGGDTLAIIAARYQTTWQTLASYNRLANPNLIYIDQHICIPGHSSTAAVQSGPSPILGLTNLFPYGQCTWWAAQRYYQLHHVYVPWMTNANAWQWTQRAYDFHWHVTSQPTVGAIVDLQPGVQGAYGLGHVAVVERVLSNGDVIASSMNWGIYYWQVTDAEFAPGSGVTFITA